jgi:integrase
MVFVGQKGGKLDNWDRWLKANFKKSGVDGWSAHALRRTTATLAGKTGAAPHVVSVILGHANLGGQLVAGYNKSRYETEHANILQDVADCIDQMYQPKQQATGAA